MDAEKLNALYQRQLESLNKTWQSRLEQVVAESSQRAAMLAQETERLRSNVSDSMMEASMCRIQCADDVKEFLTRYAAGGYVSVPLLHVFLERKITALRAEKQDDCADADRACKRGCDSMDVDDSAASTEAQRKRAFTGPATAATTPALNPTRPRKRPFCDAPSPFPLISLSPRQCSSSSPASSAKRRHFEVTTPC
ncbi:hypothetical protein DIPPA_35228 [Diplonema papillatum]|nr:hypothetical protein DIPPA_35228 [Diplonema papillatum]